MASINDPLLAGANAADGEKGATTEVVDAASSTKPVPRRKCYVAIAGLSLTSLGLLGLLGLECEYSPLISPKSPATLLVQGWGDASCYTVTGGSCMFSNCNAKRGAVCSSDYNCVCAKGCTGADGICRNISSYSLVGKNVRLRNVKYSDQYLFAPRTFFMEQLRTTGTAGQYADLWNIYKMPGYDSQDGQEMFLLSPVEFPEYAAGVADPKIDEDMLFGDKFIVSLYHLTSRHLLENRWPYDIAFVMNNICKPRGHPEAVEINGHAVSDGYRRASWYIHDASWKVFGWISTVRSDDPGEGGYWVPEPPLDVPLQLCRQRQQKS